LNNADRDRDIHHDPLVTLGKSDPLPVVT